MGPHVGNVIATTTHYFKSIACATDDRQCHPLRRELVSRKIASPATSVRGKCLVHSTVEISNEVCIIVPHTSHDGNRASCYEPLLTTSRTWTVTGADRAWIARGTKKPAQSAEQTRRA